MIKSLNTKKEASDIPTFSISSFDFGNKKAYKLLNDITGESATIIPECGAMLNSLVLGKSHKLYEIIDGSGSEELMLTEGNKTYKSKLLFPYPNRTKGGLYLYEGKMYQFEINDIDGYNNSLHGLCANAAFEIVHQEVKKTKASLQIKYTLDGKHPAYPFGMALTVVYELSKKGLDVWTEVHNIGSRIAPFGLGWHPYFKTGSKIDTLELWFPPHFELEVDQQLIPTGKKNSSYGFTSFEALNSVSLDNGYQLYPDLIQANIKIKDPVQDFYIEMCFLKGYEYLQIYTPAHRNSIAVEPQTCAANALNNKMGLIELMPDEKRNFAYSIAVK